MTYLGMIEIKVSQTLLKGFHENYSDLFIKITRYFYKLCSRNKTSLVKTR